MEKETRPHFSLGESESYASMTSESTASSSANLVHHVPSDLSQTGRKYSLDSGRLNSRCYGGNFPVIEETIHHRCSENDLSVNNTGCNNQFHRGSDVSCPHCGGKNSKYCSEQCRTIFIAYNKIKKYMIILSILNVILMLILTGLILGGVILMYKYDKHDTIATSTESPAKSKLTDSESEKCEIKCKDLVYKLNLLEDIKSLNKECCTLKDAVNYFIKYINRNKRNNYSGGVRPALQLRGGKPSGISSEPTNYIQNWKWDDLMRVRQDVSYDNNTVTILVSGHYFIYSRIHFSAKIKDGAAASSNQMPVTHALFRRQIGGIFKSLQASTIKCSIHQNTTIHSSLLEGMAYLRVGEELKIGLNHGENLEFISKSDNYFGLFKL